MPGSGPSAAAGNSASSTVVHPTSVLVLSSSSSSVIQSSTLFSSPSPSTPTPNSTATVTTPDRLLATPQTISSSTSSASHTDSSTISSTSTTSTFSTTKNGHDASNLDVASGGWSPAVYTPLTHGRVALAEDSIWGTYSTNHRDHGRGTSTSNPAPEPTTNIPTFTRTSVSSIISGATASTKGPSHIHTFTKWSKFPHQYDSAEPDSITVATQPTQSGAITQTTTALESTGPGSFTPVPTASSSVFPSSTSTSNSLLPSILGLVLGLLGIGALGVTLFRCRARRRSKYMLPTLPCDSASSREQKHRMMSEETPRANAVTSYRFSSTQAPEHVTTLISHAGESLQSNNGHLSDPFADSSAIVSSRTSTPPASIHSVDSVSTNMEFARSVNAADRWDVGDSGRLVDASTSSLELQFVAPLVVGHDSSTHSPYLSPTWHYDGQSPTSGSRDPKEEESDEHCHGHVAPPTPAKPFFLGTESARLRLHALLKEARGV